MERPKYKITPYDEVNDIWVLHKHVWWFFYRQTGSVGPKEKLIDFVKEKGEEVKVCD